MNWYMLKFFGGGKSINCGHDKKSVKEIVERTSGKKIESIRELTVDEITRIQSGWYPEEKEEE